MGYTTSFDGEFTIVPPLTWAETKASPFEEERAKSRNVDVKIRVEETECETDDGIVIHRAGVALLPTWDEEMRGYNIVEHVQRFLDEHPDHTLSGRLDCRGEGAGDLWRLEIHDGRAVKVQPRIIWPDGTEEAMP